MSGWFHRLACVQARKAPNTWSWSLSIVTARRPPPWFMGSARSLWVTMPLRAIFTISCLYIILIYLNIIFFLYDLCLLFLVMNYCCIVVNFIINIWSIVLFILQKWRSYPTTGNEQSIGPHLLAVYDHWGISGTINIYYFVHYMYTFIFFHYIIQYFYINNIVI